jgi:putative oxidoreductase
MKDRRGSDIAARMPARPRHRGSRPSAAAMESQMRLGPSRFDVTNPIVILRVMCGLFYVPHVLFKLNGFEGSLAFFAKAGFSPAGFWLVLAIATESICAVALTLGLFTRYVGLMSAGVMGFAIYATLNTKGMGWMWNMGGVEYLVFWGVASAAVSLEAWKSHLAPTRRAALQPAE